MFLMIFHFGIFDNLGSSCFLTTPSGGSMPKFEAECSCCNKSHRIPSRAKGIRIIGFSCVDFSKQSSSFDPEHLRFYKGEGQTGITFSSFMEDLRLHGGEAVIAENVDEITKLSSEVRMYILEKFHEMGWDCHIDLVESVLHGSNQTRVRGFITAFRRAAFDLSLNLRDNLKAAAETRQEMQGIKVRDAETCLFTDEHWYTKQLENLTAEKEEPEGYFGEWRDQLETLMTPQFLWSHLQPPEWLANLTLYSRLPEREKCLL